MITRRRLSKALCVLGVLTCMVAVIAPSAYGDGIVDGVTETLPVDAPDVPAVTQVTESAPQVEQVTTQVTQTTTQVTQTTAPVTGTVDQVINSTAEVPGGQGATVPAPTTVQTSTSTSVSAPSTSGAVAQPSTSNDVSSTPATGETSSSSGSSGGGTVASTGTGGGSGATSVSSVAASPQQERMPTFSNNSFAAFGGSKVAAAGGKPGDILDDLLDIGNSIGVDQVRGLQITNARGDADPAAAPKTSNESSSAPAPLALTGIAIGGFLALGSLLVLVGNGARSAGSVSAA